ncbi:MULTISPECIES: class F sortase [unclassified Streptomyces]|uniref:class F sortase n=1 Tax=unclassified Streptomyces TaxID=2593676 RepID=UPI0030D20D6A
MTSLSGRAFVAVVSAALLVGCGGHQAAPAADRRSAGATATARPGGTPAGSPSGARQVRALGRSVPVGLRIPAIGVDTPLMRLGLAADGAVQVPPIASHDLAGWYRYSPTPGQKGPSVILGHVTVGTYGDGVFRRLARLRRGDRIVVRLENGRSAGFTVGEVRTVAKADFPADAVYGDVDRPELRLITCGGPRSGTGYRDNVIVFADLTSASH